MSEQPIPLSDRELEILRLVATGATNHEIARVLVISANTVKVHLRNIFAKLEVASRTEATMVAVRRGWVQVPHSAEDAALEPPPERPIPRQPAPALPQVERWPRVALAKRNLLAVALILAAVSLFLPRMVNIQAEGSPSNPIRGVFPTPTPAAGPTTGRWRSRAQMPTPRSGLAVTAYDGLVYAIGGIANDGVSNQVEVYDPRADAWMGGAAKPTAVGFVSAGVVSGRIYVPGGIGADQEYQRALEIYDPQQDRWQAGTPLPTALAGYALAVLDDQIYLFGGLGDRGYVAEVLRYDPAADRWETRRPMAEARGLLGAAALGGRIYVVGGYRDGTELNTCDVYDPADDSWDDCPPMALRRGGLALVAVRDNLYAIGGGMDGYLAFSERYDSRVGVWHRIETPVIEQWRGLGAVFINPNIYAIGGWKGENLTVNEAFQALFSQILILP